MKIWLSKNSEISVREQIFAQITLGILSGDLTVGEKLPSTRELARRFQIHANTVGAAYKKLAEKNLVEFRRGSGFYVSGAEAENADDKPNLDALALEFFRAAQSLGFSRAEIYASLKKRFENKAPERILVVEPDADLRRILIEEIEAATGCAVSGTNYEEFEGKLRAAENVIIAAMPNEKQKLEAALPAAAPRVFITPRSVSSSMDGQTRPEKDDLTAVVSAWASFLALAKTVLVAAEIDADSIVARSTKQASWRKGLENAALIICDAPTAKNFDANDKRVRVFRLIADDSIGELKQLLEAANG